LTPDNAAPVADLDFILDWPSTRVDHAAAIEAFWAREGGTDATQLAQVRLPQVVLHVQDRQGTVVAVCTAARTDAERLGEMVYYYRSFVTAAWRKHGIALSMLQHAEQCLAEHARSNDFPCIGILVEIQSRELREIAKRAFWPRTRFSYIGRNAAGNKLFVHYFDGAMLKD
jgi:GNAT superfamily N-acetyltransferase